MRLLPITVTHGTVSSPLLLLFHLNLAQAWLLAPWERLFNGGKEGDWPIKTEGLGRSSLSCNGQGLSELVNPFPNVTVFPEREDAFFPPTGVLGNKANRHTDKYIVSDETSADNK